MITRMPAIGEEIEYNPHALQGGREWKPAGRIVAIHGNLAYTFDPSLPEDAHKKYFGGSPIPEGCETANNGFIWNFHDTMNQMHRIKNS